MKSIVAAAFVATACASDAHLDKLVNDDTFINQLNAKKLAWTAGKNSKFEGMTLRQAKRLMGTRFGTPEQKAKFANMKKSDLVPLPKSALPTSFNATQNWPQCAHLIGQARDQSDCGSCWAHGSTESFNDRLCIVHGVQTMISVQDTTSCCDGSAGCSSSGCDGGYLEDAWENFFINTGVVTGGNYQDTATCFPYQLPECEHHVTGPYEPCTNVCPNGECATPACPTENNQGCQSGYGTAWNQDKHFALTGYGVDGNEEAIMTEIYTRGPVSFAMQVHADFLSYKSGVYQFDGTSELLGGHAMKIIGWGTEAGIDYWLVMNSWNPTWGDYGMIKIQRGVDMCGCEDDVVAGTV